MQAAKGADSKPLFLARNEWRCTVKPGKLQFTLFRIGWDGFWLPPFKNRIKSVTHINEVGQRVPLKVETLPDGRRRVKISLLSGRDTMGAAVVMEIDGEDVER